MDCIFVRAKPKKISVKETYYYKAVVGDNRDWKFDRAEGEITIEFFYDGHHDGYFSADAREDVRIQEPEEKASKAQVGHLAIVKAGRSAWKDRRFEGETIAVTINVEKLQEKLESSQKLTIKYLYRPYEPESPAVRLGDVLLTDQEPIRGDSVANLPAEISFYPNPVLLIEFIASLPGELAEAKDLSLERIKALLEAGKGGKSQEIAFLPGDANSGEIYNNLLALAQSDLGGYLFIGIGPDGNIDGLSEDEESSLPGRVVEAVFRPYRPIPVAKPLVTLMGNDDGDKKLGIVIVPPGLKDRYNKRDEEGDIYVERDLSINAALIEDLIRQGQGQETVFIDEDIGVDELAKTFVALANTREGGHVLLGVQASTHKQDNYIIGVKVGDTRTYWQKAGLALRSIKPALWPFCRENYVPLKRQDSEVASILAFYVPGNLPEVYSFGSKCWHREQQENKELEPSEVFGLFAQRYETNVQEAIAIGEPPEVKFGYLHWPYITLDSQESESILPGASSARKFEENTHSPSKRHIYFPSKYDPTRGALEWHGVRFSKEKDSSFFYNYKVELRQKVENPEELRQTDDAGRLRVRDFLTGHFDVSLGPILLSGLEVKYYEAQGNPLPEEIFSRQTIISVDVTLRISELFKQRRPLLHRRLEFDGVKPELARYIDVREVLQDLGLRIRSGDNWEDGVFVGNLTLVTEKRSAEGKFTVILRITNYRYPILRQISYGERVDSVEVPSGRMTIDIYGWVDGSGNVELVELLNQLQWQLKERFRYVKVG